MARALLPLLFFLISSCATIGGRDEVLSVDSAPRGAEIMLDGVRVGATPTFASTRRKRTHTLGLLDPVSGKVLANQKQTCNIRWITSILGNGVIAIVSAPLALAGLGIDFLTGAAFDCRGALKANFDGHDAKLRPDCHTYLVAPPEHADAGVSRQLRIMWLQSARKTLSPCDRIVREAEADEVFGYINLTHRDTSALAHLTRAHANLLGQAVKADRLVVIHEDLTGDPPRIVPETIDLHGLTRRFEKPIELTGRTAEELSQRSRPSWLLYSVSLIPNALMYGLPRMIRRIDPPAGQTLTKERERATLPRLLSFIGINTVDHPLGYGEWDATLRLFPSIDVGVWDLDLTVEDEAGVSRQLDVSTIYVQTLFNLGLSAYTPIGIFGIALGAGPMPFWVYEETPKFRVRGSFGYEYSWTFFTSRNIFLWAAWKEHEVRGAIETKGFRTKRWVESSINIGYFTVAPERWFRKIF